MTWGDFRREQLRTSIYLAEIQSAEQEMVSNDLTKNDERYLPKNDQAVPNKYVEKEPNLSENVKATETNEFVKNQEMPKELYEIDENEQEDRGEEPPAEELIENRRPLPRERPFSLAQLVRRARRVGTSRKRSSCSNPQGCQCRPGGHSLGQKLEVFSM